MKHLASFLCLFLLLTIASTAQEDIFPDTRKFLDSIVEYDYSSIDDSIRRSKIEYAEYTNGLHKSIEYYRWFENDRKWVHDYGKNHNRIDNYYDGSGNMV